MKISRLVDDRPAGPLTGVEGLPIIQDGGTKGVRMSEVTAAARAPIAAELDGGASAYGSWLQQPGNAGKSVVEFLATLKGLKGDKGDQGDIGSTGAPGLGSSLYSWIAYANDASGLSGFTTGTWTNQTFIGIATNKSTGTPSSSAGDYVWSRIQGDAGVAGAPGADGTPRFTWVAFALDPTGSTGFTTGAWSNQTYIGLAFNKTTSVESTNPADYEWSRFQGPAGPQGSTGATGGPGPQGNALFTWTAYCDDGYANFTTGSWTSQSYIGISNNNLSATESTNPADYVWSRIRGYDGVPGTPGANGEPTFTWFAYANDASGSTGFTTGAWTGQTYLGIAANKSTATESTNPADYTWSLMKGADGAPGSKGDKGDKGDPGTSPSATYPAMSFGGTPTITAQYPNQISLDNGQTLTVAGVLGTPSPSGSGSVQMQIQIAPSGSGSWNAISGGSQSSTFAPGEPANLDYSGTYTNSSGAKQVYDLRVVVTKTGAGAITVTNASSYIRPQ